MSNTDKVIKNNFTLNEDNHELWYDLSVEIIKPLLKCIGDKYKGSKITTNHIKNRTEIIITPKFITVEDFKNKVRELKNTFSIFEIEHHSYSNLEIKFQINSLLICNSFDEINLLVKSMSVANKYNL